MTAVPEGPRRLWPALGRVFVVGLLFGLVEAALANDALGFAGLGVGFREVLPIAVAIAVLAVRPPRDALERAD